MDTRTRLAVAVLVSIAAVYVLFFRKTDEDRVRAKLRALSEAVHQGEGENELLRAARIQKAFPTLLTREVALHVPELSEGRSSRQELATVAIGAGQKTRTLSLRFEDVHVEVERPVQRCWATATATVSGTLRQGGGQGGTRTVVLRFDREEDDWRIADVAIAGGAR